MKSSKPIKTNSKLIFGSFYWLKNAFLCSEIYDSAIRYTAKLLPQ